MGDHAPIPMTEAARLNLIRHRQSIIEDLDVESISDHLISTFALSIDDVELINSGRTRRRKAVQLLNMLSTSGQHAYNSTYTALKEAQPHLATFLENAVTGENRPRTRGSVDGFNEAIADVMLRKGGVPIPPTVFTARPEYIDAVKGALRQISEKPGWVVVHGIGGIGKSVLAAYALRDTEILSDHFPGGLFWVSIGEIDKTKLLSKVQNLCARLDEDNDRSPPHNLEEGKDRLRTLFLEKHPRSLLILDDVWSSKVILSFDVQARVLVTTRDKGVAERVMGDVHFVSLEKGFDEEQALATLARWTNKDVEDLPLEAKEIYEISKGFPLVISIIGALLRDHPTRWKYYLDKLRDKRFDSLKKTTTYEYRSVGDAMKISLEQLEAEQLKIYSSFAIFNDDVPIPATVLGVIHGKEQEWIEDLMEEIINKSLAHQEWDSQLSCMTYKLHDLQLDYLQAQYKDSLQDMNQSLVEGYKKKCGGKYHLLPPDGYAHMYLAFHMAQAKLGGELTKLLANLCWIERKVALTGPANTLSDYVSFGDCIPEGERPAVRQCQAFISVNAHRLMQTPLPDILQLGLLQPDDSSVCRQARALVKQKKGGMYLEWCNKYLVRDSLLMTNTPHSGVAMNAQFTPSGDHILSCGEDGTVKLWCSQSGKQVFCLEADTSWVNWCEVSPDGDKIATCSGSAVKLWRRRDQAMVKKIPGDWLRVTFSHDGTKIAMCSTDGIIQIVELHSDRRMMIRGHEVVIRALCFSHNDRYVVSCSDDSAVKVFDTITKKNEPMLTYSGHSSLVVNCSCSPDNQHVASAGQSAVHVWKLTSGELVGKCMTEADSVLCCEYSPQGDIIAGGLSSFEIVLWETRRYKPVAVFKGHTSWVMSVKFDVKGEKLVSASDDETVRTWKVEYGHTDLKSVWKRDFTACFCDGDKRLKFVIAGDNKNRCLITDGRGDQPTVVSEESRRIRTFCLSSDKKKVAYGSDAGHVKVVAVENHSVERAHDVHSKEVRRCVFTRDGYTLVTCSNDSTVKIWKEDGEVIECQGHQQAVTWCEIYDNDTKIISSSHDGTLKVWDLKTGANLATVEAHGDWIFTCRVSPDDSMVTSVSVDRTAKVWDLNSLTLQQSLENHIDSVRTCGFSPDSCHLATGDDSGITRVWDVETGIEQGRCEKHNSWVTDIKFSPDSQTVVTAGENVRFWQLDGTPIQTFHVRGSFIRQVQIKDDFQTFVTIDSAGILYLMCRVQPNGAEEETKKKKKCHEVVYV